jgi:hypothetical protein
MDGKNKLESTEQTNDDIKHFCYVRREQGGGEDPKVDKFYSISKVEESVVNVKKWKK